MDISILGRIRSKVVRRARRQIMSAIGWHPFDTLRSVGEWWRFQRYVPAEPAVLLVEPNAYHAEILPGYSHYLRSMGYTVVLLERWENARLSPFCRVDSRERPTAFVMTPFFMRLSMRSSGLARYAWCFLTSATYSQAFGFWGRYLDYVGRVPGTRHGCVAVEHSACEARDWLTRKNAQVTQIALGGMPQKGLELPMVSPHSFGTLNRRKGLSDVRRIVVAGAVSPDSPAFTRMLDSIKCVERMGIASFEVLVVGRIASTFDSSRLPGSVSLAGFVDFPTLFSIIESGHFLMTLLDPGEESSSRFLNGDVSGARQLALGFSIIPITHRRIGESFGFADDVSILYESGSLEQAIVEAITMEEARYGEMQHRLAVRAQIYRDESIANLCQVMQPDARQVGQ